MWANPSVLSPFRDAVSCAQARVAVTLPTSCRRKKIARPAPLVMKPNDATGVDQVPVRLLHPPAPRRTGMPRFGGAFFRTYDPIEVDCNTDTCPRTAASRGTKFPPFH